MFLFIAISYNRDSFFSYACVVCTTKLASVHVHIYWIEIGPLLFLKRKRKKKLISLRPLNWAMAQLLAASTTNSNENLNFLLFTKHTTSNRNIQTQTHRHKIILVLCALFRFILWEIFDFCSHSALCLVRLSLISHIHFIWADIFFLFASRDCCCFCCSKSMCTNWTYTHIWDK